MKAIILNEPGDTSQLLYTEIEKPIPSENEVLVKVKAISINPVDVKTRAGKGIFGRIKDESPLILGWDISGIIESVGTNAMQFNIGDDVFGMVKFPGHGKAYAEYVVVPADQIALKPSNISHEEAAAATLAALTALQVLKTHTKTGDKILIHSAAGGVGHYAVQIAKLMNQYVIGTASEKNHDFLNSLGIDEIIDYTKTDFETAVSDVDFVFDMISGAQLIKSVRVTTKGGTVLSLPSGAGIEDAKELAEKAGITVALQLVESNGNDMRQIADWLASGKLKSTVSETYKFDEMAKAHQSIGTGKTRGKIIITL